MSTSGVPDDDLDPRLEQALRARLREVDDLVPPPAPDFAARAVAAARAQAPTAEEAPARLAPVVPLHRRGWAKALVGLAATLVLGTGVVTGLQHLGSGGSSSASSGAAAHSGPEAASPASVPQGAATTTGRVPTDTSADRGEGVQLSSMRATGTTTASLPDAVAQLRQQLTRPPYDAARASVAVIGTTVVVTLPATTGSTAAAPAPGLEALVSGALPAGTLVEYRAG